MRPVSAAVYDAAELGAGVVDVWVHGGSVHGGDERVVQVLHEVGDVTEGALDRGGRREVGEELGDEPLGGVLGEGGIPVGVEAVVHVVPEAPRGVFRRSVLQVAVAVGRGERVVLAVPVVQFGDLREGGWW